MGVALTCCQHVTVAENAENPAHPAVNARGASCRDARASPSQPERRHLFAVAHEQHVSDEHGMVPRLPLDRLELRNLAVLVGGGCHE